MSRTTLWTATVLVGVLLSVIVAEAMLRLSGRTPWIYTAFDSREPTTHEFDPRPGWRAKQGSFFVPPKDPSGTGIHYTFDARGRRRTRAGERPPGNEMVIVGGSFAQGWGIDDEETFAWKLQERFPSMNVMNYGTGGYGTYQSLLVLEDELPLLKSPVVVLYGFILEPVRPPTKLLAKFLEVNHIQYADCGFPFEGMTVPGDMHLDGEMNTLWFDRIADDLGELAGPA